MKTLQDIESFGGIDADNDDYIIDCFEDHQAYLDLINFRKFLIVGRKGAGKTAIFKKLLLTHSHNVFSLGHNFTDYPWHYHDKQARIGIPDYDKFTHSWKYLILLSLSKIILNMDNSLPFDDLSMDYMTKIEKFVVDTYGSRDPDITQIFTPTKSLKLKPNFEVDFKLLKAGIEAEKVPMTELPVIVQEVNDNLTNYCLASLNPEHKYYICFDQLDLGFNPSDPEYYNRLIGLLLASRDINLRAKQLGKKLIISVFLRDDIYNSLQFEDKNKITENFLSLIEWDSTNSSKTLKGLMEKRFNKLLADNLDEIIKWEDIFDETKEMAGHQSKYQHVIDRTYLRPRDIIKFCNEILRQYKNSSMASREEPEEDETEKNKFQNAHINFAKADYSGYLLNELADEIHKHIPDYLNYMEIFKSIGIAQFSKEDFLLAYKLKQSSLNLTIDPIKILKDLFVFSVIGYYRAGGAGYGGSEYIYKYKDPRAQFDESADRFRIHLGLMEVLGLKRYSKKD